MAERWSVAKWCPTAVLPEAWAEDTLPIGERGPFKIVHCSGEALAHEVCAALNLPADVEDGLKKLREDWEEHGD